MQLPSLAKKKKMLEINRFFLQLFSIRIRSFFVIVLADNIKEAEAE